MLSAALYAASSLAVALLNGKCLLRTLGSTGHIEVPEEGLNPEGFHLVFLGILFRNNHYILNFQVCCQTSSSAHHFFRGRAA